MEVASVFQKMMHSEAMLSAKGSFQSERGKGWLACCYALLIGIPTRLEKRPFVLEISPRGNRSLWKRLFDGKDFSTYVRQRGNLLYERKFPASFVFELSADTEGGIYYRFRSFRLLGIPVPGFFAVRPQAECKALGTNEWSFCVHVHTFRNKLVLKYWGRAVLGE